MKISTRSSLFLAVFILGCGSKSDDNSGAKVITVDKKADSYIEDKDQNDNLTIKETECDLKNNNKITQYLNSEALGSGFIVELDLTLPSVEKWTGDKYNVTEASSSCGAPGYRALQTSDLIEAKGNMGSVMQFLYSCGATCEYTLTSKTVGSDGKFTKLAVSWICTNIQRINLNDQQPFGAAIDKQIGKAECT